MLTFSTTYLTLFNLIILNSIINNAHLKNTSNCNNINNSNADSSALINISIQFTKCFQHTTKNSKQKTKLQLNFIRAFHNHRTVEPPTLHQVGRHALGCYKF